MLLPDGFPSQSLEQMSDEAFWERAREEAERVSLAFLAPHAPSTSGIASTPTREGAHPHLYLECVLDSATVLLPLSAMIEVIPAPARYTRLPDTPAWMPGLAAWKDEVMVVVSLDAYLGEIGKVGVQGARSHSHLAMPSSRGFLLVTRHPALLLGLLIHAPGRTLALDLEHIDASADISSPLGALPPEAMLGTTSGIPILNIDALLEDIVLRVGEGAEGARSGTLSPEDLEVVRAFLASEDFATLPPDTDTHSDTDQPVTRPGERVEAVQDIPLDIDEEMLAIFTNEVSEDIASLRQALELVENDERPDSPGLLALRRLTHKISGTTAAIGCQSMSTIAHNIETLASLVQRGRVELFTALMGISQAIGALHLTLESVAGTGQESMLPLLSLQDDFEAMNLLALPGEDDGQLEALPPDLQIERLLNHVEQMVEQQNALQDAWQAVTQALAETAAPNETIADFASASSRVQLALDHLDEHLRQQAAHVASIREDAHSLHTAHHHQMRQKMVH